MKIKTIISGILLGGAVLATGCVSDYVARVDSKGATGLEYHTAASLKHSGRNYEVVGQVHSESWNVSMYWKSNENSYRRAVDNLSKSARKLNADAVVDVTTKVENHYEMAIIVFFFPFVFNHEEAHASGTAIRYVN